MPNPLKRDTAEEIRERTARKISAVYETLRGKREITDSKQPVLPEGASNVTPVSNQTLVSNQTRVSDTTHVASDAGVENDTGGRVGNDARVGSDASQAASDQTPVSDKTPMSDTTPAYETTPEYQSACSVVRALSNWAQFGVLAFLRILLPPEGGTICMRALARDLGMGVRQIQRHIVALESTGFISTVSISQDGRCVVFDTGVGSVATRSCSSSLDSKDLKETTTTLSESTCTNPAHVPNRYSAKTTQFKNPFQKIGDESRRSMIAFALLTVRKRPEDLTRQAYDRIVSFMRTSGDGGDREGVALVLEYAGRAKDNLSGYLSSVLDRGGRPSVTALDKATRVMDYSKQIRDEIDDKILWREWIRIAATFGEKIYPETKEAAIQARETLLDRIRHIVES